MRRHNGWGYSHMSFDIPSALPSTDTIRTAKIKKKKNCPIGEAVLRGKI